MASENKWARGKRDEKNREREKESFRRYSPFDRFSYFLSHSLPFPLTVWKALTTVAYCLNKYPRWSLSLFRLPFRLFYLLLALTAFSLLLLFSFFLLFKCCCFSTSYYSLVMISSQSACSLYAAFFSRHSFLPQLSSLWVFCTIFSLYLSLFLYLSLTRCKFT